MGNRPRLHGIPEPKEARMELIPVMDLLDGQVVHAVGGNRERYQPFHASRYIFDTPRDLAQAWIEDWDPIAIYVADLNSIEGRGDNRKSIAEFSGLTTRFLVDAGFRNWRDSLKLFQSLPGDLNWVPVFGTETLESPEDLAVGLSDGGAWSLDECFISVDCRRNRIVGPGGQELGRSDEGLRLVSQLAELGFRNFIILDLDSVGTGDSQWITWLPSQVGNQYSLKLLAGGGIGDWSQIESLGRWGFSGALVATALHSGAIRPRR